MRVDTEIKGEKKRKKKRKIRGEKEKFLGSKEIDSNLPRVVWKFLGFTVNLRWPQLPPLLWDARRGPDRTRYC